jgi:hypothetical protein
MPAKMITVKTSDTITEKPNPKYIKWVTCDQALLGYILSSLSQEVLMGVTTHTSSAAVWGTLADMIGATMRKGATTISEYFSKMKNLADEMVGFSQPHGDEEFVAYVLTGLDEELYNSLVSSIVTRVKPISPTELFSQMLSYELHLVKQLGGDYSSHSSGNATTRGRGGS